MITTITPEQKARFQEWRDKWTKIGLSTEPADFEKAEKAALRAYKFCGLEHPKLILRMSSPYGATLGGATAWLAIREASGINGKLSDVRQQIEHQVWLQVGRLVWCQRLQQEAYQQVDQQVWLQVSQPVGRQVHAAIGRQVYEQVYQQVQRQHEQQVDQYVERQVRQQVEQQLGWQVWPQLDQQTVLSAAEEGFDNKHGGSFSASWCAYVTFLRDVLGWEDSALENFSIEEDLARSCGWVWWHKDVLAISDRPSEIHLDTEGRLHNESGPSIAYRDGWKLYHVHGVAVPDFVVERPEAITVKHITKEANAEVRRVMVERMGLGRFVRESGLQPVHSDDFGTLYRKEMPNDEPLVVVKVVNSTPNPDGSRKEYFLRVPPYVTRARQAIAWTFGMVEDEYRPATET